MYYPKGEFRTLRSLDAKANADFKRRKSELLKIMAAADMSWAWGSTHKEEKKK